MQNQPDSGARLRALTRTGWVNALGFGLSAVFLYAYYFVVLNRSVPSWWTDSYEYAQVGRNVADGVGLVTSAPHVVEVWLLRAQALPLPYLLHDPGQALLLGFFFKLFGASDAAVGWSTGVFYILIPPLTYLFARRAFNASVAFVAALLALFNNQMIAFGLTGLSEVPYAFFVTCCLFGLYRQRTWWDLLITGALFGWLAILRSNALPFMLLGAVFIALDPPETRNWRLRERLGQIFRAPIKPLVNVMLLLLGFAVVFAPNAARNYSLIKHPLYNAASIYALVFYTNAIPGKSANFLSMPGLDVDPVSYLGAHPDELLSKINYQLTRTFNQLWEGGIDNQMTWIDAALIVLLLLGVVVPRGNENARQKYLRWLVYLCLVAALAAGSLTNLRWRHLYGFIPVILIFDADLLLLLFRGANDWLDKRLPRHVPIAAAGLSITMVVFAGLGLWAAQRATIVGDAENRDYRGVARWVERYTPPDALVLAEQGEESFGMQSSLAWYTGREFIEYSEFTAQLLPEKRGVQPTYLLLISTDVDNRSAILATPEMAGYTEIARLERASLPEAVLYALSKVSKSPE